MGEEAVRSYKKHIILRTSWVFSYRGQNFLKTILELIQEKSSLNIVNDQKGTPTSADAIADVAYKIIKTILKNPIRVNLLQLKLQLISPQNSHKNTNRRQYNIKNKSQTQWISKFTKDF